MKVLRVVQPSRRLSSDDRVKLKDIGARTLREEFPSGTVLLCDCATVHKRTAHRAATQFTAGKRRQPRLARRSRVPQCDGEATTLQDNDA
ncbi:hypothetical protein BST61_g138 [Cercospora zeina]